MRRAPAPSRPYAVLPVRLRPEVGDAALFGPRDFRSAAPVTGGRRATPSFFIGVTGDGSLPVWS
ncbi:hypothetical protein SUDANB106_03193 [Streptomyces sp. enrichment culture]|uniref:hypothetical protein n=1 Tax=Streptomyces sp. enrichment culture TaxID=1795815 RepID=UPI00218A8425|nr:hypothetical protein LUW77_17940 [Streptomyces radiopugnans]